MSIDIYQGASPEQRDIIDSTGGIFVNAVPGSGKTTTAAKLFIKRALNNKKKYSGIAFLSYSNTAVSELRKAIHKQNSDIDIDSYNYIGTLDSFVDRFIIHKFFNICDWLHNNPSLVEKLPDKKYLQENINDFYLSADDFAIAPIFRTKNSSTFSYTEAREAIISAISQAGTYTHEMRWFIAYEILQSELVCNLISNRFPEIIVDEAQDTKAAYFLVLNQLKIFSTHDTNISLLGDSFQNIYEYADARVSTLKKIALEWNLTPYPLTTTYRCAKNITRFINEIFKTTILSHDSIANSGNVYVSLGKPNDVSLKGIITGHENSCVLPLRSREGKDSLNFLERGKRVLIFSIFEIFWLKNKKHDIHTAFKRLYNLISKQRPKNNEVDIKELCIRLISEINCIQEERLGDKLQNYILTLNQALNSINFIPVILLSQREIQTLNTNQTDICKSLRRYIETVTIHSTKGETYDLVIQQLNLEQANLLYESLSGVMSIEQKEELRVFFVSFSRARDVLYVVFPENFKQSKFAAFTRIPEVKIIQ